MIRQQWGLRPVFAQARGAESEFTTLPEDIRILEIVRTVLHTN